MHSKRKAATELTCAGTTCTEDQAVLLQLRAKVFVDSSLTVTVLNTAAQLAVGTILLELVSGTALLLTRLVVFVFPGFLLQDNMLGI